MKICHFLLSVVSITRMHIGLKICHVVQIVVSITEGPKNKIMRKSGIHSSVPCWDSRISEKKKLKVKSFEATAIAQYIFQNNTSAIKERPQETPFYSIFLGHPANQKLF